jgi:hypothetical protein
MEQEKIKPITQKLIYKKLDYVQHSPSKAASLKRLSH